MRKSMLLLCAAAVGVAACNPAGTSNNAAEAANEEAPSANTAGTVDGGGAPAADANAAQSAATGGGEIRPTPVKFRGCPRIVNVEKPGGCMVVKSQLDGKTYDIDSAVPRPAPGKLIIEGTGLDDGTIGICQTGTHLTDIKWHDTTTKCPIGEAKE